MVLVLGTFTRLTKASFDNSGSLLVPTGWSSEIVGGEVAGDNCSSVWSKVTSNSSFRSVKDIFLQFNSGQRNGCFYHLP